jgi:thymidylate kinase
MAPPALHPSLRAAFAALDDAGVRWCVLRGAAALADPVGDVDLLVAPGDTARAEHVFATLGFVRIPAWGYGSHRFHFGYHQPDDRWIKLDVVSELAFGPAFALRAPGTAACLARRRRLGPVAVPSPDDGFWALLLHCLLDESAVPPEHRDELRALAAGATVDGPLARALDAACPPGWSAAAVVAATRAGAWDALAELAPALAAGWARRDPIGTARRRLAGAALGRLAKPLTALRRRGLAVAVLGPDGAGKSTAVAGVRASFRLPVRTIYMAPYRRGPAAHRPARLPGIGLGATLARQWARWLVAEYHRGRGRLVIFDRYGYDAMLPPRRPASRRARWRRRLIARACPAPGLVAVLDAPGEALHARSGEQSAAVLERERLHYLELSRRVRRAVVIDATRDADSVRRELVAEIWRAYGEQARPSRGAREAGYPASPRRPGSPAHAPSPAGAPSRR